MKRQQGNGDPGFILFVIAAFVLVWIVYTLKESLNVGWEVALEFFTDMLIVVGVGIGFYFLNKLYFYSNAYTFADYLPIMLGGIWWAMWGLLDAWSGHLVPPEILWDGDSIGEIAWYATWYVKALGILIVAIGPLIYRINKKM